MSKLLQCRYLTSSTSSSVKDIFNYGKHREVAYVQVLNDVGYDPLRWIYVITDDTTVDLPYSKPLLVYVSRESYRGVYMGGIYNISFWQ